VSSIISGLMVKGENGKYFPTWQRLDAITPWCCGKEDCLWQVCWF